MEWVRYFSWVLFLLVWLIRMVICKNSGNKAYAYIMPTCLFEWVNVGYGPWRIKANRGLSWNAATPLENLMLVFFHCAYGILMLLFFVFLHFVVPMRIDPMGNPGRFTQRKPAATESRYPSLRAGSFRLSIIHRTLTWTWTTRSLTCVRDHSYACVYTRGLGTPIANQHNAFDSEKLSQFIVSCAPDTQAGFEPPIFESRIRHSTNWATLSPHVAN